MKKNQVSGIALALGVAAVFAVAPVSVSAKSTEARNIHCMGVNTCKGHSSCKSANNTCKGQNACKGQGFVEVSKEVCEQLGGTVAKS